MRLLILDVPLAIATLTSIEAFARSEGQVDVIYDISEDDIEDCQVTFQVEAGDFDDLGERVVASHKLSCHRGQNFTFRGLRTAPNDILRVCAWLEFGPLIYHTNSICADVQIGQRQVASSRVARVHESSTSEPILPLVLTLVFLGVGIATLVVLYLIVKGYLSDRHRAELFRMRCCSFQTVDVSGPVGPGGPGLWMRWTHRFFMWKRRHHRPVPASDELMLREDSTFDTSVV